MSTADDAVLNRELATYLRAMGLPAPLAGLSARLTRVVTVERAIICNTEPTAVRATVADWFTDRDQSRLLDDVTNSDIATVRGVVLVHGHGASLGSRVPKLVLAVADVATDGAEHSRVTIRTHANVGRLAGRQVISVATAACEQVASDMANTFSAADSSAT
jgi:hypothetical protein